MEEIFKPNLSPREIIERGAFGGSYFGIDIGMEEEDYSTLFESLFKDLDKELYLSSKYTPKRNKFKIRSGMGYGYWRDMGWMREQDPRGWFQWYCNYYLGRRSVDDNRQIKRWNDFCGKEGRWRNNIYSKIYETGNWNTSPRVQQSLLHWGYEINEKDYNIWIEQIYSSKDWCQYAGMPSPYAYMK